MVFAFAPDSENAQPAGTVELVPELASVLKFSVYGNPAVVMVMAWAEMVAAAKDKRTTILSFISQILSMVRRFGFPNPTAAVTMPTNGWRCHRCRSSVQLIQDQCARS